MSFQKIHLRKLLTAFGLPEKKLVALLRGDIRQHIANEKGEARRGGDFHVPFWSDAKDFVLKGTDLKSKTESRVNSNKRRGRLYPSLQQGFMDWWQNKNRFNNEQVEPFPAKIKGQVEFSNLDALVKVDNFMGLSIGEDDKRLIYPYFSETPELSSENARLGLWLLAKAFPQHSADDFRILDVIRGRSFSTHELTLTGVEESTFLSKYGRLLKRWNDLREEY